MGREYFTPPWRWSPCRMSARLFSHLGPSEAYDKKMISIYRRWRSAGIISLPLTYRGATSVKWRNRRRYWHTAQAYRGEISVAQIPMIDAAYLYRDAFQPKQCRWSLKRLMILPLGARSHSFSVASRFAILMFEREVAWKYATMMNMDLFAFYDVKSLANLW